MSKLAKCPICGEEMGRNEYGRIMCWGCGIEFYHLSTVSRLARLVRDGRVKRLQEALNEAAWALGVAAEHEADPSIPTEGEKWWAGKAQEARTALAGSGESRPES